MKIELGDLAKDKVTGFQGRVTGHAEYLTGCDSYLLAPPVDESGKHVEARWFDEHRLEVAAGDRLVLDDDKGDGACEEAPVK